MSESVIAIETKAYEDEKLVVRLAATSNEITIKVHNKIAGKEVLPNGYLIGVNYMQIALEG